MRTSHHFAVALPFLFAIHATAFAKPPVWCPVYDPGQIHSGLGLGDMESQPGASPRNHHDPAFVSIHGCLPSRGLNTYATSRSSAAEGFPALYFGGDIGGGIPYIYDSNARGPQISPIPYDSRSTSVAMVRADPYLASRIIVDNLGTTLYPRNEFTDWMKITHVGPIGPIPAYTGGVLPFTDVFHYVELDHTMNAGTVSVPARGGFDVSVTVYAMPMCVYTRPIDGWPQYWLTPSGTNEQTACPDYYVPAKKAPKKDDPCDKTPKVGNPILPLTGAKREVVELGIGLGSAPLEFTYDTTDRKTNEKGLSAIVSADSPGMGSVWRSSFHKRLLLTLSTDSKTYAVQRGDGTKSYFKPTSTGFAPFSGGDQLIQNIALGVFYFIDGTSGAVETYKEDGTLQAINLQSGEILTYVNSTGASTVAPASGYPLTVMDGHGRSISFEYTLPLGADPLTGGVISKITDPNGNKIIPTFNSNGMLTSIKWQDGAIRSFLYENTNYNWPLTGIVDENGVRYSTYGYDIYGNATSTSHAGGYSYSVHYDKPPLMDTTTLALNSDRSVLFVSQDWTPASGITVTNPMGQVSSLTSVAADGVPILSGLSQPAGAGCQAASKAAQYDLSGNQISKDDFNGSRTCSAYDDRGHVIRTVSGLPSTFDCATIQNAGVTFPQSASVDSSTWDAKWPLITKRETMGRVDNMIYNGNPDPFNSNIVASCSSAPLLPNSSAIPLLCKLVTQAKRANGTLDPAKIDTTVFAYGSDGNIQSLTKNNGFTNIYEYYTDTTPTHAIGDLKSIVNGFGQKTSINSYDPSGKVLSFIDSNGITNTLTYDLRGRLTSESLVAGTLAPRVKSYVYDQIGQITQVTNPNGGINVYTYTNDHQISTVTDPYGNKTANTFDSAGNVVMNSVANPLGLVKQVTRKVFDGLNRVQQITSSAQ